MEIAEGSGPAVTRRTELGRWTESEGLGKDHS